MYFQIYQEAQAGALAARNAGQWRWRLRAVNHEIIATGESYHNKQDCLAAIALVQSTSAQTRIEEA